MTRQLLIYQTEDGRLKVEARLENEILWLTQQQMAELFQTSQQNISLHLQNVFDEGELQREATHKDFLLVRQEGARQVSGPDGVCNPVRNVCGIAKWIEMIGSRLQTPTRSSTTPQI